MPASGVLPPETASLASLNAPPLTHLQFRSNTEDRMRRPPELGPSPRKQSSRAPFHPASKVVGCRIGR